MPGGFEFSYGALRERNDRTRPRFFMRPIVDEKATLNKDTPVFKDVEYVEIQSPGNQLEIPILRVKDSHRERWPEQYAAFKRGEEAPLNGYPLSDWPQVTRAMVETMKSVGIQTVEDLAEAPEESLKQVGPIYYNLKFKAQEFIKHNEAEKIKIADLEKANLELIERLEKLEAKASTEDNEPKVIEEEPESKVSSTKGKKTTGARTKAK